MGKVSQERHTDVYETSPSPGLSFGQMFGALMSLYGVREGERTKFLARVNKVQRAGVPIGANVGKGPRVRYSLDQFFQLLVVLELAELSISLNNAARMVSFWWPDSPMSLAPAHAWLGHLKGSSPSVLLLATASELEGFSQHADPLEARDAEARRFIAGAQDRPRDTLGVVTADSLIRDGKFDLSCTSLNPRLWRTSIVDLSTLVPLVVKILKEGELVSEHDFTAWARQRCEEYEHQAH